MVYKIKNIKELSKAQYYIESAKSKSDSNSAVSYMIKADENLDEAKEEEFAMAKIREKK